MSGASTYQILIIENDQSDLELIQIQLQKSDIDFQFHLAKNKNEFDDFLQNNPLPDAIISDYHLPDYNGEQALFTIREIHSYLPFILVTGYLDEQEAVQLMREGASDIIMKNRLDRLEPAVKREISNYKDREMIREKVEKTNNRFRTLVEQSGDVVVILSDEGIPNYITPSVEQVFGYSSEEAKKINVKDVTHPDDFPKVRKALEEAQNNPGKSVSVPPVRMKHKNGTWKWFETLLTDLRHEPAINGIVDNIRDVHEDVTNARINKLMLNNTEDSFVYIDQNYLIQNFNDRFFKNYKEIFGKEVEVGKSIIEYAQPDRRETLKEIYQRVFNGETVEGKLPVNTKNGETRYFDIKYKPAYDEKETIIGSFVSLIETTEEEHAKLELKQNEARFRALVENGSDILLILDENGQPTYSSPSVEHILGYTPEEVTDLSFFEKAHPDDIPMIQEEIAKCLEKPGETIEVPPARLQDKKGNWHWFEGTITNMLHEPAVGGIVDNFREITERVKAEKRIQQAKDQYQSLVQSINGIVWEADVETFTFNYVSPQAKTLLGYDPEEWIGKTGFWQEKIHPEERAKTVQYCENETKEGRNHSFEYRMQKADGEYVWMQDVVTVVKENGKPASLRGLMIDITQEKELEEKLEAAYDLAQIGSWELDLQNEKLYWSDYVKKIHEVPGDFEPQLEPAINFYKAGWSRNRVSELVNNAIESGESFDDELIILTANDKERWVRVLGEPEFKDGKCIRIYGSTQDITERKKAEILRDETLKQLGERVKEQRCLYEISKLQEQQKSVDEVLEEAVKIIPQGWQHSSIAEACIQWNKKVFKTKNYRETPWELKKSFTKNLHQKLSISVVYTSDKPLTEDPVFPSEEHELLDAIGEQLSTKIQQIVNRNEKETERINKEALINSTQDLIWSIDPEMNLITGNEGFIAALEAQTGQSVEVGDSVFKGIEANTKYVQQWTNYYERALGGEQFTVENKEPDPDKKHDIWYEISFNPIKRNDSIEGVACFARNITVTKLAQFEKEQAEKKYRNVVEHSTNMFYQHDTEGVLTYVSPQSMEFLGHPPEEAMRKWTEFITDHPKNTEGEKLTIKAIETGEIQPPYELQLKTRDERIIWVEVHEAPLIEDGEVTGIVGSLTDITDRKQYEEQLQKSLERYNYASKATQDAIYDWDIITDHHHWGEGFKALFGHNANAEQFTIEEWLKYVHPDDVDEMQKDLQFSLEDSSFNKWQFEYRFKRENGEYAHVVDNGYIIRNEDGKAVRMIGVVRDVTEEKQAEIQTQLQHQVAQFFKNQDRLNPILDNLLHYLAEYNKFSFAEIWVASKVEDHLNKISWFARDAAGKHFYEETSDVVKSKLKNGIQGLAWETQSIQILDDLESSQSFIRSKEAEKTGIQSACAIPLFHNDEPVGVLILGSTESGEVLKNKINPYEVLQDFLGAEIRRKQQEEEMLLLFQSAPDILAIATTDKEFIRVNPAFYETLGYTEDELLSRNYESFVHPEDLSETQKFLETISEKGRANNYINRWISKSGETHYISWSSSDQFGEDGFVFTFGRDVTDRMELEQLLKQTNRLAKVGSWELKIQNNDDNSMYWSETTREIVEVDESFDTKLSAGIDFFNKGSKEVIEEAIAKAIEHGTPFDEELALTTAKGNIRYVRCIGEADFLNGSCERIYGSIQDITKRKEAELKLEDALAEKNTILESIGDAFFTVNHDWIVTYWNKEAEEVLSKPRDEIIGKNLWEEYEDAMELQFYPEYHKAVKDQVNVSFQEYYPPVDRWFEVSAYPSEDGLSVYFKDITERKKALLELEQAYEEKENILDSIADGFFTLDRHWNVTYWNRAAEVLLQTPKQDVLHENLWDVFQDATALPSYTNYHRVMHERKAISFEDYYESLDKWFDINAYPSEDGISVFFKDISERKRAREALERLNKELETRAQELATSNAELEQFAYVASHDLQEPLRMVTSFLTQLDKKYGDKLDDKANQYIDFAVDGAQRMRQIILDLLNYSRLNQEKNKRERVDLNEIIEDVKALERSHIQETDARIYAENLPTIYANPGPIKQVFQNLINNAIKYQESGTAPEVEISCLESDTHWEFKVKDNGIGIREEFQSTIFQIFQRLHTRDQYSGTGIGLAITKKIIERHGGEIWLESEEGKGTTFYFTISKE